MTAVAQRSDGDTANLWRVLADIPDPEIPVLSLVDLGVIRYATVEAEGTARIGLSPTYSGCPATEVIRGMIARALAAQGIRAEIVEVLSPPWTSDWISSAGRQKLRDYGIAPPEESVGSPRRLLQGDLKVTCPRCGSRETARISEFGSTPCKALYRCTSCLEPFDYFKCL